jgi:hypothetical protein
LHQADEGVWIDEKAVPTAIGRLLESVAARPERVKNRVPAALEAALSSFEKNRSILSALGLAHERPANTRMLVERLLAVVDMAPSPETEGQW